MCQNRAMFLNMAQLNTGYVQMPAAAYIATEYTISFWVAVPSIAPATTTTAWVSFLNATNQTFLNIMHSPRISVDFSSPGCNYVGPNNRLNWGPDTWHHVAILRTVNTVYTYIDGALISAYLTCPHSTDVYDTCFIGRQANLTRPNSVVKLDDFRIYNRAITIAEITALVQFTGAGAVPAPTPAPTPAPKRKINWIWFLVFAIVVICILFAIIGYRKLTT